MPERYPEAFRLYSRLDQGFGVGGEKARILSSGPPTKRMLLLPD